MRKNIYLAITFGILFCLLLLALTNQTLQAWDSSLTLRIYNLFQSSIVTSILTLITDYAIVAVAGLFLVALFVHIRHTLTTAIVFLVSSGILIAGVEMLKAIIQRPRPFVNLQGLVYLGMVAPDRFSFPSSHSALAFFCAYFITRTLRLSRLETIVAYGLAALVAISRIYLGAHYVTDTLAGAVLGICIAELAFIAAKLIFRKHKLN